MREQGGKRKHDRGKTYGRRHTGRQGRGREKRVDNRGDVVGYWIGVDVLERLTGRGAAVAVATTTGTGGETERYRWPTGPLSIGAAETLRWRAVSLPPRPKPLATRPRPPPPAALRLRCGRGPAGVRKGVSKSSDGSGKGVIRGCRAGAGGYLRREGVPRPRDAGREIHLHAYTAHTQSNDTEIARTMTTRA